MPHLLTSLALLAAQASVPAPNAIIGQWSNPKGTMEVRTRQCGANLCGRVVRASEKAQAAARDAGAPPLVGSDLLKNYSRTGERQWSGRIFIPKLGRDVPSQIRQTSADTITISGCMMGGLVCKTQVWHRVG